jgi:hypothetical protein
LIAAFLMVCQSLTPLRSPSIPKTYITIVFNSAEAYLVQTLPVFFQLRYVRYGVQDMGIEDENLAKIVREIDAEEKKLVAHPLFQVLKMLEITFPWILITIFNSSSKNS